MEFIKHICREYGSVAGAIIATLGAMLVSIVSLLLKEYVDIRKEERHENKEFKAKQKEKMRELVCLIKEAPRGYIKTIEFKNFVFANKEYLEPFGKELSKQLSKSFMNRNYAEELAKNIIQYLDQDITPTGEA
jgi:arginine decarboxylase-like protein